MSSPVSRRLVLQGGVAAAAGGALLLYPRDARAATWTKSVGADSLGIGAATFAFASIDSAPTSYQLTCEAKNSAGTKLKAYVLNAYDMAGTPTVTVTIKHYVSGNLRRTEYASWDAAGLVSSDWNSSSYDSVAVHNWMVQDTGWASSAGGNPVFFSGIGSGTC